MMNLQTVAERFSSLESCSTSFEYPAGGCVPIPLESEMALVALLREASPVTSDALSQARQNRSFNECYGCVIFAVRMGILAARTNDIEMFRLGLQGLFLEAGQVDYRDLLGALSILELCAQRLRLEFQSEMGALSDKLDVRTRATVEGYFERPIEIRNVESMGFIVEEREEGICITSHN